MSFPFAFLRYVTAVKTFQFWLLFHTELRAGNAKQIETIPTATMKALIEYWPGNVRELGNFIERAVILTPRATLEAPLTELRRRCVAEGLQSAPGKTGTTLRE
jgi:DNA-binding NtrC family response regulator